jgi:ketosteroid isomerase-like protein
MKKLIALFVSLFLFLGILFAQFKDEMAIRNILKVQTAAWNNGNIETFMKGYWQNDSLMFIGKSGVTYGWQKTRNNYKKNYPDTTSMGKLDFVILEVKKLSVVHFFVVGKWHLARSIGDLSGHFTLLFKKINGNWFIVADHSS